MSEGERADAPVKKADNPGVIARPPALYLGFILAGLVLDYIWPLSVLPIVVALPAGVLLISAGFLIVAAAMRQFRAAGTNVPTPLPATTIVTDGLYGLSRNPIYIGLTLVYLGIGTVLDNPWIWGLLLVLLPVMRYGVIAREERYLERKFGDTYLAYKQSVRRWI